MSLASVLSSWQRHRWRIVVRFSVSFTTRSRWALNFACSWSSRYLLALWLMTTTLCAVLLLPSGFESYLVQVFALHASANVWLFRDTNALFLVCDMFCTFRVFCWLTFLLNFSDLLVYSGRDLNLLPRDCFRISATFFTIIHKFFSLLIIVFSTKSFLFKDWRKLYQPVVFEISCLVLESIV